MIDLTFMDWKKEVAKGTPLVIDCYADWCGSCKQLKPVIDQLDKEFEKEVTIAKYDVDEGEELTEEYSVRALPTVLFFNKGKLVKSHSGPDTYESLRSKFLWLVNKEETAV